MPSYTVAVPHGGDPTSEHNELRTGLMALEDGVLAGFSGWGFPGNVWFSTGNSNMSAVIPCDNNAGVFFGNMARLDENRTLLGLRIKIPTAAAGGNTMRLGAYKIVNGAPVLAADAGTVTTDSTGDKIITGLSVPLGPGTYLVGGASTVGSLAITVHNMRSAFSPMYDLNPDIHGPRSWYIPGVGTGALPSTPTGLAKCQDWPETFVPVLMGW